MALWVLVTPVPWLERAMKEEYNGELRGIEDDRVWEGLKIKRDIRVTEN